LIFITFLGKTFDSSFILLYCVEKPINTAEPKKIKFSQKDLGGVILITA